MRELKFRCWDGKRFHEWGYINKGFEVVFVSPPAPHFPSQQFTEYDDRNGKEIYEGDIVNRIINNKVIEGIITFKDGAFRMNNTILHFYHKDVIVISNIYESVFRLISLV